MEIILDAIQPVALIAIALIGLALKSSREHIKMMGDQIDALQEDREKDRERIEQLECKNRSLEQRVTQQGRLLTELNDGIQILISQIKRLGREPEWTPNSTTQFANDDVSIAGGWEWEL